MRRLLLLCCLLAACAAPPAPDNNSGVPRNPPTLPAPTQFVEVEQAITLNNVANLKYIGRLDPPQPVSTVFDVASSPDVTRLVGLNNEQLLSWDLLTGKLLFQTARQNALRIFYAPDKTELYGVDEQGYAGVFDANTGALKTSFEGHANYAGVVAYDADDGWLAFGGTDGTVKVWDASQRQSLVTINADTLALTALAFSADGTMLATAGTDNLVRAWRWKDRALIAQTTLDSALNLQRMAFSPNGSVLAIASDKDAHLWSLNQQPPIALETGAGGANQLLTFSPDGRFLLGGNQTVGLSLWNDSDGSLAARLPDTAGQTLSASFSPDGTMLITSALSGKVLLWNLIQVSSTVNQAELKVGTQQILTVQWTDDGRLILFFDASGPIYVWGVG